MRPLIALLVLLLVAAPLSAAPKVVVLGLFKDRAVLEVNGKRRVLAVGQLTPEGIRLLAADSDAAVLEIDGQQQRLALGTQIGGSYQAPAMREVQLWPDNEGMYNVSGTINGQPVDFLVDTGATYVAMNAGEARRLGIDYRVVGERGMVTTASGTAPVFQVKLDKVQVGELVVYNVAAVVLEGDQPEQALLGMSFLGRLELQRQGALMLLRQNQ